MSASEGYIELVVDVMSGLGHTTVRRMFGGAGVFIDGVMVGLIADDVLYLKADSSTKIRFEEEGLGPFTYTGKSRPVEMSYWKAPERLLESPDEMEDWGRAALSVAQKAAAAKPKRKRTKKTSTRKI